MRPYIESVKYWVGKNVSNYSFSEKSCLLVAEIICNTFSCSIHIWKDIVSSKFLLKFVYSIKFVAWNNYPEVLKYYVAKPIGAIIYKVNSSVEMNVFKMQYFFKFREWICIHF